MGCDTIRYHTPDGLLMKGLCLTKQKISNYDNPKNDAVVTENLEVVLLDVGDQELDGNDGYKEGHNHAENENHEFVGGEPEAEFYEL